MHLVLVGFQLKVAQLLDDGAPSIRIESSHGPDARDPTWHIIRISHWLTCDVR